MAKNDPTTEVLRNENGLISADTFRQEEITMPVSVPHGLAMLISKIIFSSDGYGAAVVADNDSISQSLSDRSVAATVQIDNEAHIASWHQVVALGAVFFYVTDQGLRVWEFNPPLLYAKTKMFHQFDSGGFGATIQGRVNIHYTLEKVSKQVFIDALTE